jgi:hypothetical protein
MLNVMMLTLIIIKEQLISLDDPACPLDGAPPQLSRG